MAVDEPDIQLIASVVVEHADGRVLFVRYHADDDRWWLPGEDLEPYEHPDERARKTLERIGELTVTSLSPAFVESFRGRRGWHVAFHYHARAHGQPGGAIPAQWFPRDELPRTVHGRWEREAVRRVLSGGGPG